ncbi:MAG: L,D-transpeptidase family protein [Novosphingobium sp.]
MKRLLPLLLLASCSRAPDDPSVPQWSKEQIASLKAWAQKAPQDALPLFDTSELDKLAGGWDKLATRRAATVLAEQLATAHLRGCAPVADRQGWLIDDRLDSAGLRERLVAALSSGENLDSFFGSVRPAHSQYAALQSAYMAETDPGRRLTLARNLERWRWMPQSLGEDYVLVDIPRFEVGLWRRGAHVQTWPAIVGKTSTPTPVFAAQMQSVTFNPWWFVPPSIIRSGGVGRRGYVWTKGGTVKQPPGPRNALGQVKIEMPNPYAIFLHDTPSRGLFSAPYRAYSHGCVRVGDAMGFAATLLRDQYSRTQVDWLAGIRNQPRVSRPAPRPAAAGQEQASADQYKTQSVALPVKLPVYVAYFTAAARDDGTLAFSPDLYKLDAGISDPAGQGKRCEIPDEAKLFAMRSNTGAKVSGAP